MPDEHSATSEPAPPENGGPRVEGGEGAKSEFATLRQLLVGPEQHRLEELATEIKERQVSAANLAKHLPEAIHLRGKRDRQIGRALGPTVETALRESIRKNPRDMATAIFPVLGPAIRKALAETMSALVRSINSAVEASFSPRGILWRIESWRTGVPYAQVVIRHALVYRVEQAFLIHAETGILLAHATAPDLKVPDADLISGMMTAIQDFVRDSFRPGEGATLRTFSVGDHTVQVEAGPLALLALVIRGDAPEQVLHDQQDMLETIHLQFASALAEFTGDTAPFESARGLLEECLETVVNTGRNRRGRFLWLRWGIPVALGASALIVLAVQSSARFQRAVAMLNNEPGLVVINADRGWRDWEISGLRDPQARTPQAVLAGAGLVPRSLLGRWESYMSLDSAVVAARARQAWRIPPTTMLSLRGDTMTVSGELPLSSMRVIAYAGLPPGIQVVDLDDARVVLTPYLDSIRAGVEAARVLFAPGASEVWGSGLVRVQNIATRFRILDDSLTASAADITLALLGRTDPTGSNETNQALSQWRVDGVAAVFASAGVRMQHLRREALATSRPLTSPDPAEEASINRSVSFEIRVSSRPRIPGDR